jgi:hypothetical protein
MHLLFVSSALSVQCAARADSRILQPKRTGPIVFRPFALVTFIWASK